jgi:hypothetical protein
MSTVPCTRAIWPHELVQTTPENDIFVIFRSRLNGCPKASAQTIFFNSGPHGISEGVRTLRRSVS